MVLGRLLGSGRTADVYALDDDRVVRRVHTGIDLSGEVAALAHVVQHGYPAPRLFEVRGQEMIMERLAGPTMLTALASEDLGLKDAAAILADLLRRLHQLPPRPGAERGTRLLHLDLHPDNVILSSSGPMVIDWANAQDGLPALDVALSALIIAQVAADSEHPATDVARGLLAAFLDHDLDPLSELTTAAQRRAADPAMTTREVQVIPDAVALIRTLAE